MNAKMICLATTGLFLGALGAQSAHAQSCAEHAAVQELLADRYGESRQSIGMGSDNSVVEIYASLDTGTWTITVTRPGGPTCLVASGFGFEHLNEALPAASEGA
jgi:hypothetical protein